jgi:hypothetical protein
LVASDWWRVTKGQHEEKKKLLERYCPTDSEKLELYKNTEYERGRSTARTLHNLHNGEKILFSSKDMVFLHVPVGCCIGKIKRASAKKKGGANLLKISVFTQVVAKTWRMKMGYTSCNLSIRGQLKQNNPPVNEGCQGEHMF